MYLKLESLFQVKIVYGEDKDFQKIKGQSILDLGVYRTYQNNILTISLSEHHQKFFPIILLREGYYCFIPKMLITNDLVKIFISSIIELDIQKLSIYKEW